MCQPFFKLFLQKKPDSPLYKTKRECLKHSRFVLSFCVCKNSDYLRVILAPSASILALMSSASALEAPSFRTFGAPSTTSFASFSPRPVTSRTTLITLTLFGPTSVSSTSNSSFSSAASAAPPAAATTTPAAADTPNSSSHAFTRSFSSNTVNSFDCFDKLSGCHFCHFIFLHYFLI